jgi:hypothetical protein
MFVDVHHANAGTRLFARSDATRSATTNIHVHLSQPSPEETGYMTIFGHPARNFLLRVTVFP